MDEKQRGSRGQEYYNSFFNPHLIKEDFIRQKKCISLLLSLVMIFSLTSPAFAASSDTSAPVRISRSAVEEIHGDTKVMTEAEAVRAANLIAEKENLEALSTSSISSERSAVAASARIATDDIVIFDTDAYFESDYDQYIEMAASVAGVIFEDVFEKLPY